MKSIAFIWHPILWMYGLLVNKLPSKLAKIRILVLREVKIELQLSILK